MHLCDHTHLVASVAAQAELIVQPDRLIPMGAMQSYWTASRCRLSRWASGMKVMPGSPKSNADRNRVVPIIEETIISEMLTRVWTAVIAAVDRHHRQREIDPIARSIYIGHLEARRRTLQLLVEGRVVGESQVNRLNRLRRQVERWTDILLGRVALVGDVNEFAFDSNRASDFAASFRAESARGGLQLAWPLLMSSMASSFVQYNFQEPPNPKLNQQIANCIHLCFGLDLVPACAAIDSNWQRRLELTAIQTESLVRDLLVDG